MALLWTDGDWTTAQAVSGCNFECPIPGVNVAYVLKQDFVIAEASWSPLALGTAHGTYATFKLASEGPIQDIGGGKVKWTRTYAKKPSDHTDYESYNYNFIGFAGSEGINVETQTGRARFTQTVTSKIVSAYYEVGTSPATPADIAIIAATKYIEAGTTDQMTDYLKDSPPYATATSPSRSTYEGYISTDAGTGSSFSLVAEPSSVSLWMGNIYVRRTRYIKAL